METTQSKPLSEMSLSEIASVIRRDWRKNNLPNISPYAKPYVDAMATMQSISENYVLDSGSDIVARFLCNATSWRGDVARQVKKELNARLKGVK